jgi:aminoglycoside phosphotransferase (APT) family kinase protein
MDPSISLEPVFDELEETDGDNECREWIAKVFDAKPELARFAADRRGRGPVIEYVGVLNGSFNLAFRFRFDDDGPDAIIRLPKAGQTTTALRDEKVTNEVHIMQFLGEKTTIPIPHIYSWGLTEECPHQLGPFIIMDFVEGVLLCDILQKPTNDDQELVILNPDIEKSVLDKIYSQLADYLYQLSKLEFAGIGAISRDENSSAWAVTKRPLTYIMNEIASVSGFPMDQFPTNTFISTRDFLQWAAQQHLTHLSTQRNLAEDAEIARARFIARHRFAQLIDKFCADDDGIFIPFCDDMRPANMLVNPETLQITAVIDFEFTNAMPAQFAYDPPSWLLLAKPEHWLDRNAAAEFRSLYEPQLEMFLRALEKIESRKGEGHQAGSSLSARMRHSWETKQFWFDYAARKGFDVDTIYWYELHREEDGNGLNLLDSETQKEIEPFVERKMQQLRQYKEECRVRFSDD